MEQLKHNKMHYIQGDDRSQMLFTSLDSMISPNNPVRLIDLLVDKIVLNDPENFLWKGKKNKGRRAFSPATMLKLFLYGYLNKIQSSRRLEQETYRNIELKWLICNLHPDFWTINEYRKNNEKQIRLVTIEFRKFLISENYIKAKEVAVDGTKLKAYASRDMLTIADINKRLKSVNEKLSQYLEQLKIEDAIEEVKGELKEELKEENDQNINKKIIARNVYLEAQVAKLEEEKRKLEEKGKNYLAPNDPDANLVKSRQGKIAGYNAQFAVDAENKMIALSEITDSENDIYELKPDLEKLKEQVQIEPDKVYADKGYVNHKDIKEIEEQTKTECYVPVLNNNKKDKKSGLKFTYDKENNEYICPQGKKLKLRQRNKKRRRKRASYSYRVNVYQCTDCKNCPIKQKCTSSKKGRIINRHIDQEWIDNYQKRMLKPESKENMKKRKAIVEHPFGVIKWMMGLHHFLLRGKEKVQIELDLYATVYNIKRLINIEKMEILLKKIENYSW